MKMSVSAALRLAEQHVQAGRFPEAEAVCRALIDADPRQAEPYRLLGLAAFFQGQHEQAATLMQQAIERNPKLTDAYDNLAAIRQAQGRAVDAETAARKAVELEPQFAEAWNNLGNALQIQNRLEEAVGAYRQALQWRADLAAAEYNLGDSLAKLGQVADAETAYRRALALRPGYAGACGGLAVVLFRQHRDVEAQPVLQEAVRLAARDAGVLATLGVKLLDAGRSAEAEDVLRAALATDPKCAAAHLNLGVIFQARRDFPEAERSYARALSVDPRYVRAYNNLAALRALQNRANEAEAAAQQALACDPQSADAHAYLGVALHEQGRVSQAVAAFERALAVQPRHVHALINSGVAAFCLGRPAEAADFYRRVLAVDPRNMSALGNLASCEQYRPGATPADIRAAHVRWAEQIGREIGPVAAPRRTRATGPLRVGWVAPDFLRQPMTSFLIRTWEAFNPERIACYVYSDGPAADSMAERFQAKAAQWRETSRLDDRALAELIRADQIDALVDLAGHSRGGRLAMFARRPAPVQLTWIGYEGTTGLPCMDYLVADAIQVPAGSEADHVEKVLRLSSPYLSFEPLDAAAEVGPLPAERNGFVTLASFSNLAKINAQVIGLWCEILHRLPTARLALKSRLFADPGVCQQVHDAFAAHDVPSERLLLKSWSAHSELPAEYNEVDLALDPFPFSNSATTGDALWMGVPCVTLPGATFASRHTLNHLRAVGLAELAAESEQQYVDLAVGLANDLPRLAGLRQQLRARMQASPLSDGRRVAAELERLLDLVCRPSAAAKPREETP